MKAGVAIRAFQAEVFPHFCSIIAHGFKIWHFDSLCRFSLPAAISVHARCGRYNWWKAWRIGMILSKTFPFQLLHFDIEVLRMGSDHHSLMSHFDVKDLVLGILKTFIEMACFIQNVFGTNKWFWTLLIWRLGLDMFFKRLQPNLSFSWSVLFSRRQLSCPDVDRFLIAGSAICTEAASSRHLQKNVGSCTIESILNSMKLYESLRCDSCLPMALKIVQKDSLWRFSLPAVTSGEARQW